MNNNGLLNFILSSEKRRDSLFLLSDEPKTVNELKDYFGVKAPEIIPRLKELENKNLIYKIDGAYHITPLGRIFSNKIRPVVEAFEVVDSNEKFFSTHDFSPIPFHLLESISELGQCRVIESSPDDVSATNRVVSNNIATSKSITGISPLFDKSYPQYFTALAQKKMPISIILTEHVFEVIKKDYMNELKLFLSQADASLYTIKEAKIALAVTDTFTSLSLHNRDGSFDMLTNLMSFEPTSIKWGAELFEHYREKSTRVSL